MGELSLEAYRFALENTIDAVAITDMNSVIQWVNPAFSHTTGYTKEDVLGKKPSILKSEHTTLETYREMWSVILDGGWWRGEIINKKKKTGEEWYSYLSISQIRDAAGKPFAYVGISRDITKMKQLQFRLKEAGIEAIYMLSAAAEAKDDVTGSHIQRVEHYSAAIAKRLGLPAEEVEEIGYSSMMHDVGKLHIPDAVLKKPGPLSDDEWGAMREHPEHGVVILRDKPFYAAARTIAGHHHEKWDGTGYPEGKRDVEIPLVSRIVTVADVFDALTTQRPYKAAWPEEDALKELKQERGKALDPDVVDAFVALYEDGIISRIRKQFP